MKQDSGKGIIYPALDVGAGKNCPAGRACPGQGWEAGFCSIFAQDLVRVPDTGRKHVYEKCAPCKMAIRKTQEQPFEPCTPARTAVVDIYKDD